MKEISFEQLDTFYFRKEKMRSQTQNTLDTINGRNIKIEDLICKDGIIIEQKRKELIEELMDSLLIYLQYRASSSETGDPEEEKQLLDEKRYHCFSEFLYCALSELAHRPGADLSDLLDLSFRVRVFPYYIDLLMHYLQRHLLRMSEKKKEQQPISDPYEKYVKSYNSISENHPDFIDSFIWHHFPIDGWEGSGEIMSFSYRMDASEREIDTMLNILKRRNTEIPQKWLVDYEKDRELHRQLKHRFISPRYYNDHNIIAFWNFLHLQESLISSDVFTNAISGMIDIYTIRHETNIYLDFDRFYRSYDRLEKAGISSMKTDKKEAA